MTDFNDIGINGQLDWERIKKCLLLAFRRVSFFYRRYAARLGH